jgi:hypothetical protein
MLDVVTVSRSLAWVCVLVVALALVECSSVAVFAEQASTRDDSVYPVPGVARSSSKVFPKVKSQSGQYTKGKKLISETEALAKVKALPDVKQFLALFKGGKSKLNGVAKIEVESEQGKWLVHVYEQLPDHTATMNWYEVDMKTGKVSKMF